MMSNVLKKEDIEDFVDLMMENESFEDFIERFDVTLVEAFLCLYNNGLIDEEELRELMRAY